ncbi:MAG TPA: hypothetical protein VET23_05075 [Chitinophagaceae bacterium]|nr:hypothetical protein [Chitinophagaceae bacterium]
MKNRFLAVLALLGVIVIITSCYSSRKYGCPANPQTNTRFRG